MRDGGDRLLSGGGLFIQRRLTGVCILGVEQITIQTLASVKRLNTEVAGAPTLSAFLHPPPALPPAAPYPAAILPSPSSPQGLIAR